MWGAYTIVIGLFLLFIMGGVRSAFIAWEYLSKDDD